MATEYSGSVSADKTMTIEDFIALNTSDEITYYNYSLHEYLDGYEMFITNLLYDYEDELKEASVIVELTDEEKSKYKYKPYLFAYDIYGSVETKFIIMMLNGIIDPKDFDFNKVRVIRKNTLINLLSKIDSVNENLLKVNASQVKEDFKNNEGNTIWTE